MAIPFPEPRVARRPPGAGTRPAAHVPATRWRLNRGALAAALIVFAGVIAMLYPTISNWVSQANLSRLVNASTSSAEFADYSARDAALADAHRYNEALNSGALMAANANKPAGDGWGADGSLNYWTLLHVHRESPMARLQIPSIDLDLPVYHGTSESVLSKAIGHLEGTSLPVGGVGTRGVFTGHRGMAQSALFTYLDRVKVGDEFTITTLGVPITYRVTETKVVDPEQSEEIRAVPDKDLFTLVTCTPLGINTHRILVTGERVIPTPGPAVAAANAPSEVPRFPWFVPLILGVMALLALYVQRAGVVPRVAAYPLIDEDDAVDPPAPPDTSEIRLPSTLVYSGRHRSP